MSRLRHKLSLALPLAFLLAFPGTTHAASPEYTADGNLVFPADYRTWVFLTSSLDLNYDAPVPGAATDHSMLDNVFVNPEAYAAFLKTGTWPDKTVLVKENRMAASAGTISKSGKFQTDIMSVEMHIKDETRYPNKWAFFFTRGRDLNGANDGKFIPEPASCYTCHNAHAAVDTTFVQFYPTLMPVAKEKGTLSPAYGADSNGH